MNRVFLKGNVGRDPEVKETVGGSVCNFSLATKEWLGKEKGQGTEWHRCVAFGRTAETIGKYVAKGTELVIEGRLQTRAWEKEGVKRYTTEVVVSRLEFCGKREGGSSNGNGYPAPVDAPPPAGATYDGGEPPF
jgi:single-strand DNA-binding protein